MWQRIQTVFLVIAILALLATVFFPIWTYEGAGERHALYALHYSVFSTGDNGGTMVTTYMPYSLTAILAVAAITIALIEIGKYRNRVLQMKLGALNSLLIAGTILCAVLFSDEFVRTFPQGQYGLGLWLPGVAVVCNLLANRFIRRDERIVRESSRLR